jgi:hypothetical protein
MAGHLLFNSGSNESSLAPQFKWLDNTFKQIPISVRKYRFSVELTSMFARQNIHFLKFLPPAGVCGTRASGPGGRGSAC